MESTLCGTTITGKYLEKLLKNKANRPVSDDHVLTGASGAVIGEGNGYTSTVLKVSLTWVRTDQLSLEDASVDAQKPSILAINDLRRLKELRSRLARCSTWA